MHLYQSVIHPRVDPAYKTVWDTLIKNIAIEAVTKQKQLTAFTHSLWISKASWNKTETTYTQALIWGGIKKKKRKKSKYGDMGPRTSAATRAAL